MNHLIPVPKPHARRRAVVAGAALLTSLLAGCGSDDAAGPVSKSFCDVLPDYSEAARAGDRTGMARALEQGVDDVDEGSRRTIEVYMDALTAAPPNESPDGDTVETDSEAGFRDYAEENCGADALADTDADQSTTSTSTPAASTTDGGATTTTGAGAATNEPDDTSGSGEGEGDGGAVDQNESYVPTEDDGSDR